MNIEERLRDDGAQDHQNPLAGRGGDLTSRARARAHRRRAGVIGVGAAALVAVALAVPGTWWDGKVTGDPTSSPTDSSTGVTPPVPVDICDTTIDTLLPDDVSDVTASLDVGGDEVSVTLTNTSGEERSVREAGNEVWLVDPATGRVVAYQADLRVPPGVPIPAGETTEIVELLELTPCTDGPRTDGGYDLYVRGGATDTEAWVAGPLDVKVDPGWLTEG